MHIDNSVEMIIYIYIYIYRRPLIFYKSSNFMITFIDNPSSTRNLKCLMVTIVIDIIIKTVRNMDLEKSIHQKTYVASFLSSWCTSRILRIIMNTFGGFCLSVSSANDFSDNIMKYCARIISVEYVRFGNNIFKLQSSHIFSIVFCVTRYYISSVTTLIIRKKII